MILPTTSSWWLQLHFKKIWNISLTLGKQTCLKPQHHLCTLLGRITNPSPTKGTFELMLSQLSAKNCSLEGNYFIHFVQIALIQIEVKHIPTVPTKAQCPSIHCSNHTRCPRSSRQTCQMDVLTSAWTSNIEAHDIVNS